MAPKKRPSQPTTGHATAHGETACSSNDKASSRRFAHEVGREIGRQNHILAGGQ